MFSADFCIQNRAKLRKLAGKKVIVVAGNSLMQRTGDTHYIFRQNSDFLYLTGVQEPDLALVIDGATGKEFIMLDAKTGVHKVFDGDYDLDGIMAVSGITDIKSSKEGLAYIVEHSQNKHVYINTAQVWNKVDFTLNGFRQALSKKLRRRGLSTEDVRPLLAQLRMIKQPAEITAIEKAIRITKQALQELEPLVATARNENELARELHVRFAKQSVEHAFSPLIQSGIHTTVLHYDKHNADIGDNTVVLFDIGAEFSNYAADISRSFVKGTNKRATQIIEAVYEVQQALIAAVKPGQTWKKLHEYSESLILEKLIALGISSNAQDVRTYFPHAFGHFVGLDTHDVGDYTAPLAEGMTLTVEPGIYIPQESLGARIEDIVLVTKTGAKVL
jgi:Xaa-Pro aminopeptidase